MTAGQNGDIGDLMRGAGRLPDISDLGEGDLMHGLPFSKALGMRLHAAAHGVAILSVPYDPAQIGDPRTGVMHGGVITALLDTACGSAVMAASTDGRGSLRATATLDLRIDYMRPARPNHRVIARAECYRLTRAIGFARAVAFQEAAAGGEVVASAAGAFILDRPEKKEGA